MVWLLINIWNMVDTIHKIWNWSEKQLSIGQRGVFDLPLEVAGKMLWPLLTVFLAMSLQEGALPVV